MGITRSDWIIRENAQKVEQGYGGGRGQGGTGRGGFTDCEGIGGLSGLHYQGQGHTVWVTLL